MNPHARTPTRGYSLRLLMHLGWVLFLGATCGAPLLETTTYDWGKDLTDEVPAFANKQATYIKTHLDGPFQGYSAYDVGDPGMGIVALSNMASGIMNIVSLHPDQKATWKPYTRELVTRALHKATSPYKESPAEVKDLGEHGLYLSHLSLVLGIHRHVSEDKSFDKLHNRVHRHLLRASKNKSFHARSFPPSSAEKDNPNAHKWTSDQAATLAALHLHDQIHKKKTARPLIKGWLARLTSKKMTDPDTGLPRATLDDKEPYQRHARGHATSAMIGHMIQFAPKTALKIYATYRKKYARDVIGWGGFREWPKGMDRGSDERSGSVILGVGMVASEVGVGPARVARDLRQYAMLMRTVTTFGVPTAALEERRHLTMPILGEAVLFNGVTARRWFVDEQPRGEYFKEGATIAFGGMILMFLLSCFLLYSLSMAKEYFVAIWRWRRPHHIRR